MKTKKCGRCNRVLTVNYFGVDNQNRDGLKNTCKECRKIRAALYYQANADTIKLCTSEYQKTHPEVVRRKVKKHLASNPATAARSRLKRRMALAKCDYVEDVSIIILGDRDGWICQLCGQPVEPTLAGTTSMSRSIDHVIPVSLGGEHSYKNTQLAHFGCNARRRATVLT